MKIQEVKDSITAELGAYFGEHGFRLRKADFEYVKKTEKNYWIFRPGPSAWTDWFSLSPSVFYGCPRVNKLFNLALGRSITVSGSTWGFGIRNEFDHQRGNYQVEDENSLLEAVESLRKDFDEVALPWFHKVNSLESLDKHMNCPRDGTLVAESVDWACHGLIAAKLANNPSYEEIFVDYKTSLFETNNAEVAEPILVVKAYLDAL
mgnify:CR=1 FL=1